MPTEIILGIGHARRRYEHETALAHTACERFVDEAFRLARQWIRDETEAATFDGSLPVDPLWAAAVEYALFPNRETRRRLLVAAREARAGDDVLYVAAKRLREAEDRARVAAGILERAHPRIERAS